MGCAVVTREASCLALGWACLRRPNQDTNLLDWSGGAAVPAAGHRHTCLKVWTPCVDEGGKTQRLRSQHHSAGAGVCQRPPPGRGTCVRVREVPRGQGLAAAWLCPAPSALWGPPCGGGRYFLLQPGFTWPVLRGGGRRLRLTPTLPASQGQRLPGLGRLRRGQTQTAEAAVSAVMTPKPEPQVLPLFRSHPLLEGVLRTLLGPVWDGRDLRPRPARCGPLWVSRPRDARDPRAGAAPSRGSAPPPRPRQPRPCPCLASGRGTPERLPGPGRPTCATPGLPA
ncbi:transmembrane protein 210 isoform X1 [Hippopotamus amphibius kiboko]|uniref:transmembrane protein 210 isoform X1 n=1 Tax=Hippopotamus amphibius kiboko TaxID=575201 RepID=UPI00259220E1|nr:transmembrane protein 210 isoform X1 [Hippopotamus amphibius kiboko]